MTNASIESSVRPTSTTTTFSLQSHPPKPPVVRMMPQLQTSGNLHLRSTVVQVGPRESQLATPQFAMPQSSISSPARVSSSLSIQNSQMFSVLTSPTTISSPSMSPSRDVGSESVHLQPTSTFQTSFSISSSESLTTQSSRILHINPSVAFSRQGTHTKSLQTITTESVQPDEWNATLHPPLLTPQSSFTPTIIAGIVAIALALATMAGCTLIGCIVIIHCKKRPRGANGSTMERGDDIKDTISLKDDSPTPGEIAILFSVATCIEINEDSLWMTY